VSEPVGLAAVVEVEVRRDDRGDVGYLDAMLGQCLVEIVVDG